MDLVVCARCRRHTRVGAACCAFCGALSPAPTGALAPVRIGPQRIGRGALTTLACASFAATLGACYGAAPRPQPEAPPRARSFTRPEQDPNGASSAFAKAARTKGCRVDELATGVMAVCDEGMIAVQPQTSELLIECRDIELPACKALFQSIIEPTAP